MNEKIEKELLETNNLNEFRTVIIKYEIATTKELSNKALEHYNKLGSGQTAEQHNDPREN